MKKFDRKFCDKYIDEMIEHENNYSKNIFIRNIDHMNANERIVHISNLLLSEKTNLKHKNKLLNCLQVIASLLTISLILCFKFMWAGYVFSALLITLFICVVIILINEKYIKK